MDLTDSGRVRSYDIDVRKIERELGWKLAETIETGIHKTVPLYQGNLEWVSNFQSHAYLEGVVWSSPHFDRTVLS